jgi:thiol-disulfide isomerase/thioredoxin
MLIIGLQWLASQLAKIGLLPDFIAKRLGLLAAITTEQSKQGCDSGCCGGSERGGSRSRRSKRSDTSDTAASSSSSFASTSNTSNDGDNENNETVIEHVTDLTRYHEINSNCISNNNSILIVKFTAEWCKPCKLIQPTYLSLASKFGTGEKEKKCTTFITLDIDGDECDTLCSEYKIIMMPTFLSLQNGKEVGRLTGGGEENAGKLCAWVHEMVVRS